MRHNANRHEATGSVKRGSILLHGHWLQLACLFGPVSQCGGHSVEQRGAGHVCTLTHCFKTHLASEHRLRFFLLLCCRTRVGRYFHPILHLKPETASQAGDWALPQSAAGSVSRSCITRGRKFFLGARLRLEWMTWKQQQQLHRFPS